MLITLQFYVFNKIPFWVSKSIIAVLSFAIIGTLTVHGIWLGINLLSIGLLWLKYKEKSVTKTNKGN